MENGCPPSASVIYSAAHKFGSPMADRIHFPFLIQALFFIFHFPISTFEKRGKNRLRHVKRRVVSSK